MSQKGTDVLKSFLRRLALRRSQGLVESREPRMYVLVRADLPAGLQLAQACHAASYLAAANPLALYQHPTTIVVAVDNEDELKYWSSYHKHKASDPEGFMFYEPDLDGAATAFACYSSGEEFKYLPLALGDN